MQLQALLPNRINRKGARQAMLTFDAAQKTRKAVQAEG